MWSLEYLHVLQLEDCVSRSGEYTCVAENSLGVNQGTTSLPQHRLVVQEVSFLFFNGPFSCMEVTLYW